VAFVAPRARDGGRRRRQRRRSVDGHGIELDGVSVTPTRQSGALSLEVKDRHGSRTFPVSHTIGVEPLQQYLLQAEGGRLLVSPVALGHGGGTMVGPGA